MAWREGCVRVLANLRGGLSNEGDGRVDEPGPGGFVKGDQSYIVRNSEIAFSNGLQGSRPKQAVRCEDRLGGLCRIKHFQSGRVPCLDFRLDILHEFRCRSKSMRPQEFFVS